MGVWVGWAQELLGAAGLSTGTDSLAFMDEWAQNANANCKNNPVDISQRHGGSTKCKVLPSGKAAQRFSSHKEAAAAFAAQLTEKNYPHLYAGLHSGEPFATSVTDGIASDLRRWGSDKWRKAYLTQQGAITGGTGATANGLKGFNAFQHSLARELPTALRRSHVIRQQALRRLGAPRNLL